MLAERVPAGAPFLLLLAGAFQFSLSPFLRRTETFYVPILQRELVSVGLSPAKCHVPVQSSPNTQRFVFEMTKPVRSEMSSASLNLFVHPHSYFGQTERFGLFRAPSEQGTCI